MHNYTVYVIEDLAASSPVIETVSPTDGRRNVMYYGIPDWMYEGDCC